LRAASGQVGRISKVDDYLGGMPQYLERPVKDRASWESYKKRLDPYTPQRWPANWDAYVARCNQRDYALGLYAGSFFGFLREWMGLEKLLLTFYDDPALIEDMMDHMLYLTTECARRVLEHIKPDFAMIWEDMAYKNGPMISPAMFRKFIMPRYRRLTDLLRSHGVDIIIIDTDGNVNQLIPLWIESGANATWPLEVAAGNDAVELRKKYGKDFILMGNIDKRVLAEGKDEIQKEIKAKVPFLLERGGYFPSPDHMVPPDVPWENYCYYIDLLREIGGLQKIFSK
jgi:uroporphyrinogen decarboxylase